MSASLQQCLEQEREERLRNGCAGAEGRAGSVVGAQGRPPQRLTFEQRPEKSVKALYWILVLNTHTHASTVWPRGGRCSFHAINRDTCSICRGALPVVSGLALDPMLPQRTLGQHRSGLGSSVALVAGVGDHNSQDWESFRQPSPSTCLRPELMGQSIPRARLG